MFAIIFFSDAVSGAVVDYPPKGYFSPDVTTVTWAHGVNSKAALESYLANSTIQMLEGDIVMGILLGCSGGIVNCSMPIMAHPPVIVSDLSLEMFLDATISYNRARSNLTERKGLKLDYKDESAALHSLPKLKERYDQDPSQLQFPIWINADVFQGPEAGSAAKVNGSFMIDQQKSNVPTGTLSLGWTTSYRKGESYYTKEQFDQMAELLKRDNSKATITFPLRAQLALPVVELVKDLLDNSELEGMSPSVTLWEGGDDPQVERAELDRFIERIGKDRVFVDLPRGVAE